MELGYILGEGFHRTLYKIMTRKEEILNAAREYNNGITFASSSNVLHFEYGAKWADKNPPQDVVNLNDVWHDASEEPNQDITSKLIYYIEDTDNISICTLGKLLEFYGEPDLSWNSVVKNLSITKWAYINDLLPKTK